MVRHQSVVRNLAEGALVLERLNADPASARLIERGANVGEGARAGKVLVIEPDVDDFQSCRAALGGQGYVLTHAADLESARRLMSGAAFDLIILELQLGDLEGLEFCREVAAAGDTRVLIYSHRSELIDRVAGLEFGADDYIAKSSHPVEFRARVRALLRRSGRPLAYFSATSRLYVFDGWQFDAESGALAGPDGRFGWLSRSEQTLLRVFLRHPRELLTRARIEEELFGKGQLMSPRAIDVRVVRLRRAFEACSKGAADIVRTVRGGGYIFSASLSTQP
jgi:two-component system OmpR family response regulator